MPATRIVLIGAGSASFGLGTLRGLLAQQEDLAGSTIALVDLDEAAVGRMARLARRFCDELELPFGIECTTDRCEALPGARFVVISVEIDRLPTWQADFEIPLRYGVKHVLGENAGPGGLSHTLRTAPLVLDICRDVERLCPQALVLNYTNPESRICMALDRYTAVRAVGLCHQIMVGFDEVARVLGWLDGSELRGRSWTERVLAARELVDLQAAGINHFTWITAMHDRRSGEDLYPRFRRALHSVDPSFQPLSRRLHDAYGLFPATGDGHAGELVGYAWETVGLKGYDFAAAERDRLALAARIDTGLSGAIPAREFLSEPSIERVGQIIGAVASARNGYELSANIRNAPRGTQARCIGNLPDDAIVEVPVLVSADGVHGINMGDLPDGIAALCQQQALIQVLAVKAAIEGDRQAALQALLLDPTISSYQQGVDVLDALLRAHARYLPQFA
jgi:alpha-galactosidase